MTDAQIIDLKQELSLLIRRNEELDRAWDRADNEPHLYREKPIIENAMQQNNNRIKEIQESLEFLNNYKESKL